MAESICATESVYMFASVSRSPSSGGSVSFARASAASGIIDSSRAAKRKSFSSAVKDGSVACTQSTHQYATYKEMSQSFVEHDWNVDRHHFLVLLSDVLECPREQVSNLSSIQHVKTMGLTAPFGFSQMP